MTSQVDRVSTTFIQYTFCPPTAPCRQPARRIDIMLISVEEVKMIGRHFPRKVVPRQPSLEFFFV